jgi:hypothetical protein
MKEGIMGRKTLFMLASVMAVAVAVFACSKKENHETASQEETTPEKKVEYVAFGEYVNPVDSLPRVRYFETGLVTLNDRCAVRKVKLNTKMPAVYVNGQPVGFC